jgi:NAD(P)-dependent dehydrogenase (short-subunit alcohol dehydrogenase family)
MGDDTARPRVLAGRTALVTGGSSGIGLAVVRRFLAEGARVVALSRGPADEARALGAQAVRCDVTNAAAVGQAFDEAVGLLGSLDTLVLNAGTSEVDGPTLGSVDADAVRRQWEVNTLGVLHGLREADRCLADGGSVSITSTAALAWPFPGYLSYAASKAPLRELCVHAAMRLGPRGVRVNTVSPGTTLTAMQPSDDDEAHIASVATCLGRVATPDEIAGVFVFLASDDARYVTAADIRVDGGWIGGLTDREAAILLAADG